jgi:hypothetical protein
MDIADLSAPPTVEAEDEAILPEFADAGGLEPGAAQAVLIKIKPINKNIKPEINKVYGEYFIICFKYISISNRI